MLPLSQQIRMGLAFNSLYEKHTFVRGYTSLILKMAPRKYKRLLEAKRKVVPFLVMLIALCALSRLN